MPQVARHRDCLEEDLGEDDRRSDVDVDTPGEPGDEGDRVPPDVDDPVPGAQRTGIDP